MNHHLNTETKKGLYRPEIDGLRAIAVIAVILFHAGFKWFSGGYIGVDIFFVISGYLITSIILREQAAKSFSLVRFYERRIRRIIPALFFLLVICMILSWFLLIPEELKRFSKAVVAVLTFSSNIFYWKTTNYFNSGDRDLLLHTWSLAVEEQFYLVFPLLIIGLGRFGLKKLNLTLTFLGAISLALCEYGSRKFGVMNFYMASSRAWELIAGALIAVQSTNSLPSSHVSKVVSNCISGFGLMLVVVPIFQFHSATPYPSLYTAIPILGTALIIMFSGKNSIVGKLLSVSLLSGIGLISYSAYLWHQPLFAIARIYSPARPTAGLFGALSIATLLIAFLVWKFIEQPFRSSNFSRREIFTSAIMGTAILALFGIFGVAKDGFKSRYSESDLDLIELSNIDKNSAYVTKKFFELYPAFENPNKKKLLVVGDSFAQDFVNMVYENNFLENYEIGTRYIPSTCQIYLGDEDVSQFANPAVCKDSNPLSSQLSLIKHADVIVFSSHWKQWAVNRLNQTIENLHLRPQQKLIILGSKDFGNITMKRYLGKSSAELKSLRSQAAASILPVNQQMKKTLRQDIFIDQQAIYCEDSKECAVFTPEVKLISYDGQHLTKNGAVYLGKKLFDHSILGTL